MKPVALSIGKTEPLIAVSLVIAPYSISRGETYRRLARAVLALSCGAISDALAMIPSLTILNDTQVIYQSQAGRSIRYRLSKAVTA